LLYSFLYSLIFSFYCIHQRQLEKYNWYRMYCIKIKIEHPNMKINNQLSWTKEQKSVFVLMVAPCTEAEAWIFSFVKLWCQRHCDTRIKNWTWSQTSAKMSDKRLLLFDLSTQRREWYWCSISIVLLQCSICLSSTIFT